MSEVKLIQQPKSKIQIPIQLNSNRLLNGILAHVLNLHQANGTNGQLNNDPALHRTNGNILHDNQIPSSGGHSPKSASKSPDSTMDEENHRGMLNFLTLANDPKYAAYLKILKHQQAENKENPPPSVNDKPSSPSETLNASSENLKHNGTD